MPKSWHFHRMNLLAARGGDAASVWLSDTGSR
jgi:hypothetical protein